MNETEVKIKTNGCIPKMWQVAGGRWQVVGGRWQVAGGSRSFAALRRFAERTTQKLKEPTLSDANTRSPNSF